MEWIDSVTKKRDIININPLLNSQNLTTFGIQVYSCNLNYFLALDPINLQISFQLSICFEFSLFIISKIQRDENTCESLSQNWSWVENVCDPWWYCSVKTYFICNKNCMFYWLTFEFELCSNINSLSWCPQLAMWGRLGKWLTLLLFLLELEFISRFLFALFRFESEGFK